MKIVAAKPLAGYRLVLRFDDGKQGEVDVSRIGFRGVFASWRKPEEFAKVRIEPEFGTLAWPNGADLDTYVLYSMATGAPLPGGGKLPDWAQPERRRRPVAKTPRRRVAPAAAKSRKATARGSRAS